MRPVVSAVLGLIAVLLLTGATGYFVAQEFVYMAADRVALTAAAERGDGRARRALAVMGRLSFMLSGAQLGITVTALVVGFLAEPSLSRLIGAALSWTGLPAGVLATVSLVAGFALATVVQMVLGELLPKNLALARPEPLAKALASSTLVYLKVAGPLIRLFDGSANRLLRAVGVEPVEELHHGATLEELADVIGESERAGRLPADLSRLLVRALSFGDRTADEVMVPRAHLTGVAAGATIAELIDVIERTGHTDYPVYGRDIDDIVGVAGVRELADETLGPQATVGELARTAVLVPGSLPLYGVIERMREGGQEFACVVDEYGGLAGIVTFEDIAEELVGEIADENDARDAEPAARADGTWLLDAALRIDELHRLTGLSPLGRETYDTLGGLVMARLRRLPRPGDSLTVELGSEDGGLRRVRIDVLTVRRRVARQVRLRVLPETIDGTAAVAMRRA